MEDIIGLIPAGGYGKRMMPFKLWKELIPIFHTEYYMHAPNDTAPIIIAECTLRNMICGGIEAALFIVNSEKSELVRCFSDYSYKGHSVNTAFVYQNHKSGEYGIPYAIECAYSWIKGKTVFMGFPDTIVTPQSCFTELYKLHLEKKSNLTLGVFPTDHPERLAPVVLDEENNVIIIQDKPEAPLRNNTWNIIIWDSIFTELVIDFIEDARVANIKEELLLSDVFNRAIEQDLIVCGYEFQNGFCRDIGNVDELWNMFKINKIEAI